MTVTTKDAFRSKLVQVYGIFTGGFIVFTIVLLLLEVFFGLPTAFIGWCFLLLTMGLYAIIGIISRTKILDEYYVAGRRVPGIFNGMATGADWMSAASFISMAGSLWLLGYDGLAYIMGWTGGYVLLALLFAPYIRKFGQYTIPDFVGARFGGNRARAVAAVAAIIVSFTYVTAQVTGVGVIMSRFVGVDYTWGVVIGLSGVLVCSFLGGMKAVTWTQVAQYVILIIAYLVPVVFLSVQLTGFPIPELSYGQALQNVQRLEQEQGIGKGYVSPYNEPLSNASAVSSAKQVGLTPPPAKSVFPQGTGMPWEFMALTFCLMVGTAGLPHILIRFYTVPSVRESRVSVGWALFFIFLLYFTAPAYAAFSRWEILQNVVGRDVATLPSWATNWTKTGLLGIKDLTTLEGKEIAKLPTWAADQVAQGQKGELDDKGQVKGLIINDGNGDGLVQMAELSGAAVTAASTDGKLQFASAVAHDVFYRILRPNASAETRMRLGKAMVLVAAACAALAAVPRLALIVQMVAWAFSLAAASFFPVVMMGIFWRRANGPGAIAGMIGGLAVTIFYMVMNYVNPEFNVLGISHLSAGVFGVPVNFALIYVVSKLTAEPSAEMQHLVDTLRHPQEDDELMEQLLQKPMPAPAPAAK
ncbi:MAG: cation acetate symporter [Chloroflexi bacterium]|nr:cation acetate symporter [Chloroflexota bacterium]